MTDPQSQAKVTLADVAAAAGVSLATASKVANGKPDVASATRERVEAAIAELRYTPPRRRYMPGRPSIVFLADVIDSAYAADVIRGAVVAAEEAGVDLIIERTHDPSRKGVHRAQLNKRLLAADRTGAIVLTAGVTPENYARAVGARLPVVVIDPLDFSDPDVVSIGSTNWMGGRSIAEHLLSLGHERIGVLSGPTTSLSAMARLDGLLSAWVQAGRDEGSAIVEKVPFETDAAREAARVWFQDVDTHITAVAASSDAQAMGVLQAARESKLSVPEDLSVIGYDDTKLAALATPPLTTVRQPLADMGRRAVELVTQMARGHDPISRHVELATSLVVRESTGKAPKARAH